MYRIRTYNSIAAKGLAKLPPAAYEVGPEVAEPHAIMLRSADLHDLDVPGSLLAVGRAGAGVNNIPVKRLGELGVPVFNAPGANANAVKELVLAGLLLAARNIAGATRYVADLTGDGPELARAVEAGKKRFVGFELPGRVLGVVGLGAIGVRVANVARMLGMRVIGYDPAITVQRAWQLDAEVRQSGSIEALVSTADFVTFHVPLSDATRGLVDADCIARMRPGAVILNFSRPGVVDEEAVCEALAAGRLHAYVTDFPTRRLIDQAGVIALPHLGASTVEAEENCAVMIAEQLREFLEHGNIRNSVNFPDVELARAGDVRLSVVNANRPDMVGQISHELGLAGVNIAHMVNESRGEIAYTLIDTEQAICDEVLAAIARIEGVLKARCLPPPP